jgi:hypothetical protein
MLLLTLNTGFERQSIRKNFEGERAYREYGGGEEIRSTGFHGFVKDDKIHLQFLYNLLTAIIVNLSFTWGRKLSYKSHNVWPVIINVYCQS